MRRPTARKKKLDDTMAHLKFTKSTGDKCLYILHEKGKVILLVLIYVDDAVVNGVLLPSIALNCLPGCYTRMFNRSGILD
jgi:hypothetical protein